MPAKAGTFLLQDVFFNGARSLPEGVGIHQAWSVSHLAKETALQNDATLAGVAKILRQHPEISCEIRGQVLFDP